jgi:4-hydroxy-tetrahydrodipicolinate synthase
MTFEPKGTIPALVTPLTEKEEINEPALRRLIDHVIKGGAHGIFVVGTTGEFYGLSPDEKQRCFEIAVDETKGRVPVYAGTGAITTRDVIALNRRAEAAGVDAVSVLTPMFISPSQDELTKHFEIIAHETSLPVVLYNNKPRTGVTIDASTVERLATIPNVVGVKDSSGDFTLTSEYIRRTKANNFHVLAGRDTLIHACLCYGGSGAIASCGNVAPALVAEIYDKYVAGDIAGSLAAQYRLAPLRLAFGLGSFPTVIKESLSLLGIEAGPCLAPIRPMSDEEKSELKRILIEIGVLA